MVDFDAHRSAAGGGGSSGPDEQSLPEDVNFGAAPRISGYPDIIMDAEAIVGVDLLGSFMPDDGGEQNLRGPDMEWQDRAAIVLTVKNPEMQVGEYWKKTEREEGQEPAYKIVNRDSHGVGEKAEKQDGEFVVTGVEYGNASFDPSEPVNTITETVGDVMDDEEIGKHPMLAPTDTIAQFFFEQGRAQRVASVLDRVGGTDGGYRNGDQTKGIIEKPPTYGTDAHEWGADPYPRVAGTPNLRTDLYSEPVRLMRLFRDDPTDADGGFPAQTINFVAIEEVGQAVDLETAFGGGDRHHGPTDEDREYLPVEIEVEEDGISFPVGEPIYNRVYAWHTPEDDSDVSDESVEDATRDMDLGNDDGRVTYDELDEGWQEFIDAAVKRGYTTDNVGDWQSTVENAIEDDGLPVMDHEVLGRILDERQGGA